MKNRGAAGILILVSRNQSLNIRCDIESIGDSFRGELENEQGVSRSFSGWTEFATALMALARDTEKNQSKNRHRGESNMKKIRNMKRPKLATIMAGLALFIVLGGSATAASGLINGKKIKKGTVTAKQIKNKTITKGKLAPSTLSGLAGAKGEKGATGQQGPQGAQGAPGQQGPQGLPGGTITTYFESDDSPINVAANTETEVINMNGLASGRYIITVSVQAFSAGAGLVQCDLATNGGGGSAGGMFTAGANGRAVISMNRVTATAGVTQLDVDCESSGANSAYSADVTAVKTTP